MTPQASVSEGYHTQEVEMNWTSKLGMVSTEHHLDDPHPAVLAQISQASRNLTSLTHLNTSYNTSSITLTVRSNLYNNRRCIADCALLFHIANPSLLSMSPFPPTLKLDATRSLELFH
jgi:hypothetical protein